MYKSLLLVILLFASLSNIKAQTFTITSPTSGQVITMPSNQSTIGIQLGFSWIGVPPYDVDLIIVALNGNTILELEPTQPWDPPDHIDLTLSPGNHTLDVGVRFHWYYNGQHEYEEAYGSVSFHIANNLTVKNIFGGGIININSAPKQSPYSFTPLVNETVNLGAVDQQYGNYYYVWNQSGTNNSRWERKGMSDQNFTLIRVEHQETSRIL